METRANYLLIGAFTLAVIAAAFGFVFWFQNLGAVAQRTPIRAVRLASEVPAAERTRLETLRTDTRTFRDVVEARRNRRDDFYKRPAGR